MRIDKVRLFIDVPEAQAVHVRSGSTGSQATIRVPALNDRRFTGKVAMSAWSLDPQQRTMRAEIDFDNPEGLLRPGMYAHAVMDATHAQTWTLPASAVLTQDGTTFCWQLIGGKARRTPLRVGKRMEEEVQVLKKQVVQQTGDQPTWEDLNGKETVLTGNPGGLRDGQAIDLDQIGRPVRR